MPTPCRTLLALAATSALSPAWAGDVTPVSKVTELIANLLTQVEDEGRAEASEYDQFACFCKDTTDLKAKSITKSKEDMDTWAAQLEEDTAKKNEKSTELSERKAKQEQHEANLATSKSRCAAEKATYEATEADLAKAIDGLNGALKSLSEAKPASFLALRGSIEKTQMLSAALNRLPTAKRMSINNLLQQGTKVDPSDPTYKYHSQGILDTLDTLLKEFGDEKTELDEEWGKTDPACTDTQNSLTAKISSNNDAMGILETDIDGLKSTIAETREKVETGEVMLQDDDQYLKDLTTRCEARAKDWDQRSTLRAQEIEALSGALQILTNNVTALDTAVNKRALLVQKTKLPTLSHSSTVKSHIAPSFLQGLAVSATSMEARRGKALSLIQDAGLRLRSTALGALAGHLTADPFEKVKTVIQKLIERLLAEATAEATKKGFCDEALGKAKSDRKHRFADALKLNTELGTLEIKQDSLEAEIKDLKEAIKGLNADLETATTDRADSKDINIKTLIDAKSGLIAITEAITILKVFYKQAGKAKVLLQASPVDEDTAGAGFNGAYKGKQESSKGIIGMLEVIKTDFERTIRITQDSEAQEHKDFVQFDRTSRTDISGKETKQKLDEDDLATTKSSIKSKMEDMQSQMNQLDAALKVLEGLKPTCIDTGMSYDDRVTKREEEIAALKKALCILDTEQVEVDC